MTPQFPEVFNEHAEFVRRTLLRFGVPSRDVRDVTQEVFLVILAALPQYEERGKFRAWISAICFRLARAQRRRVDFLLDDGHAELAQGGALEQVLDSKRQLRELELAVAHLTPEQQLIFVMHEVDGISMRDICGHLACPLQTGYWRLHQARHRVRQRLGLSVERSRKARHPGN